METSAHRILVLSLGNDMLGDDAVGLEASRALRSEFFGQVDFEEAAGSGLELLNLLEGYEKVLLLDSVITGHQPAGSLVEFHESDFSTIVASSPHYVGLPEVLKLGHLLDIALPLDLRALAMEVENPFDFSYSISTSVRQSLPAFVARARAIVKEWMREKNERNSVPEALLEASILNGLKSA